MALDDIVKSLGDLRVTQLGHIKIGGLGASRQSASGGTWRMPRKDDHFTITTLHRSKEGDLIVDQLLMDQLLHEWADPTDGKLRQLPIRVLSDDINDVLQATYCWYTKKSCGARSDGRKVTWYQCPHLGPDFGALYPTPEVEDWDEVRHLAMRDNKGNPLFKLHGVFNCIIAAKESRFGGVYRFRTTSVISVKQLYSSLLEIMALTGGVLTGMPLMLVVRPQNVSPAGQATTVYTVHCEIRGRDVAQLQQQALEQQRWALEHKAKMIATQTQYRALLCAPEPAEEAAHIAAEFHAESQQIAAAPANYLDDTPAAPPVEAAAPPVPVDPAPVAPAPPAPVPPPPPPAPPAPPAGKPVISAADVAALKQAIDLCGFDIGRVLTALHLSSLDQFPAEHLAGLWYRINQFANDQQPKK